MRYLFVDRIDRVEEDIVEGNVGFDKESPFGALEFGHNRFVLPGVIAEACGQLASWIAMNRTEFQHRPIFYFADGIEILGFARPGDSVRLRAHIEKMTEDAFVFNGEAYVGERLILRINRCTNGFYPVSELEDPEAARQTFESLISGGRDRKDITDRGAAIQFDNYVRDVLHHSKGVQRHIKARIDAEAGFYRDHFPRRPITPMTLLNELIGDQIASMFENRNLTAKSVGPLKIKNFVEPNEDFEILVESNGSYSDVRASLIKGEKPIFRTQFSMQEFGEFPHA